MNCTRLTTLALIAGAVLLPLAVPVDANAQPAYPTQPVKIIVPFAPGGGSDFIARFIAEKLTKSLGQTVLVDNRPGAGGLLGIELGVKAPADGYTFILIASNLSLKIDGFTA